MPEIPGEIEMAAGTVHDLLMTIFAGTPIAREVIDPHTHEMRI